MGVEPLPQQKNCRRRRFFIYREPKEALGNDIRTVAPGAPSQKCGAKTVGNIVRDERRRRFREGSGKKGVKEKRAAYGPALGVDARVPHLLAANISPVLIAGQSFPFTTDFSHLSRSRRAVASNGLFLRKTFFFGQKRLRLKEYPLRF